MFKISIINLVKSNNSSEVKIGYRHQRKKVNDSKGYTGRGCYPLY